MTAIAHTSTTNVDSKTPWMLNVTDSRTAVYDHALYLVDAGSGRRIWRGVFNETQEYVFNNMFKFTDRVKMGLKWLTADELARYGVKLTLDKFPSNVIPATAENIQSGNTQK